MQIVLRIGKSITFFLLLFVTEIIVGYLFPDPFSYMNVGAIWITLYILLRESGKIVWYMFLFYFCLELLFMTEIYGAMLFAGTISVLIAYWSHRFFLTNKSIATGLLLCIITILSYRTIWYLYLLIVYIFLNKSTGIPGFSMMTLGLELLISELFVYILMVILLKKKNIA